MRDKRRHGRVLWDELCEWVREDDGLGAFVSKGMWTAHKLYFVCEYLDHTTRAMKARRGFPGGICYIDLFCGSGVTRVQQDNGTSKRYPGSSLIAGSVPNAFDRLVLVDRDAESVAAAKTRILRRGFRGEIITFQEDCNECIDRIVKEIPERALNIAFIDPCSLDIHFDTIQTLASRRAIDLIILFCDRFDLGRNVHAYYFPADVESKLDKFLGTADWRSRYQAADDHTGQKIRTLFAEIYLERLQAIGYEHSSSWPLPGPLGPAFRLVFASKNELGLKFCEIALKEDLEGNRNLFGS